MKKSISYTFLLNIVLIFIFVCFAIVMGIFSYHRAFRANNMIINAIERYEGYNCLSQTEIDRKLATISYNVPFKISCDSRSHGKSCREDKNNNYLIISYNLNHNEVEATNLSYEMLYNKTYHGYLYGDNMESEFTCNYKNGTPECTTTNKYQYGIYTYMYLDFPVINKLLRISVFGKTMEMTDFRDIAAGSHNQTGYDAGFIPEEYGKDNMKYAEDLLMYYTKSVLETEPKKIPDYGLKTSNDGEPARSYYQTITDPSITLRGFDFECGYVMDYSQY